ncbi:S46 family peptidase [Bacteroidales bacterium OttesenSCG-928-A17]|nr:S46 family peptidase [Bacteroidales bacterium OttesenSCG-928-A17]
MKRIFILLISVLILSPCLADEGMWTLNNLGQAKLAQMKKMGLTLSQKQLYDTIQPSLKDAVVHFAGGCTGVMVSEQGLLFTNHHCGYGAIQSQSSVENDYLRDGFVAQSMEEELPIPNMYVRFLLKTIDVTNQVLEGIDSSIEEKERNELTRKKMDEIANLFSNDSLSIEAEVNAYFANNRYYLNVYEIMTDIRLVFAPPSSIGKFGGDTDNWMWPRHTGDFSIFRVYANPEKKQGYHAENQPYKPKHVAPVSLQGYKENSFGMIIGYPGRTNRYLSSWGIQQRVESQNKPRIEVRGIKQEIWKEAMLQNDATRIKYSSKYAGSSNYWKNSIGMNRGIERMNVMERKQKLENDLSRWIGNHQSRVDRYGTCLNFLEYAYNGSDESQMIQTYLNEAFMSGAEIVRFVNSVNNFKPSESENPEEKFETQFASFYKNYDPELDEKVITAMLKIVKERVPAQYLPEIYQEITKKYKDDYAKYASDLFKKSSLPYPEKLKSVLLDPKKEEKLEKDPVVQLAQSVRKALNAIRDGIESYRYDIMKGERLFLAALMEMNPKTDYYSDANSTMRITYGTMNGYVPYDGAWYDYFTTQKGILEKQIADDPEFNVQPEILDMLKQKKFGKYANKEGNINVDFLSNNDITGGNSGSPIFDGKGRVIGLAFDGNWEAMSGDIAFEPNVQRCINVDVRYILYVIEHWGKCDRLLKELIIQ